MSTSITCPQCGRTSHNPNDVRKRYCGACHQYHDTMGELTPDAWAQKVFGRPYRFYDDSITQALEEALEYERLIGLTNNRLAEDVLRNIAEATVRMARQFLNSPARVQELNTPTPQREGE